MISALQPLPSFTHQLTDSFDIQKPLMTLENLLTDHFVTNCWQKTRQNFIG